MPASPALVAVWEAQRTLVLTQRELAALVGCSLRTVQRWSGGGSQPHMSDVMTIARAVHPRDAELAQRLVGFYGQTLAGAGIVAPRAAPSPSAAPSPPDPSPMLPFLAEAVVAAAAEALDVSPRVARPALLAALERAKAAGIGLDDVLSVLRPRPPAPKKATG